MILCVCVCASLHVPARARVRARVRECACVFVLDATMHLYEWMRLPVCLCFRQSIPNFFVVCVCVERFIRGQISGVQKKGVFLHF